ncbi:hypothetical protein FHG87_017724 [Trinorchestia longiramus]|nr:hypothetical protein FHG87_017724 [Trinorchestia longiramus]
MSSINSQRTPPINNTHNNHQHTQQSLTHIAIPKHTAITNTQQSPTHSNHQHTQQSPTHSNHQYTAIINTPSNHQHTQQSPTHPAITNTAITNTAITRHHHQQSQHLVRLQFLPRFESLSVMAAAGRASCRSLQWCINKSSHEATPEEAAEGKMAERSNLKKFLENDRSKPDDYLHGNVIENNNDLDAVDLNCNNNNNNNESHCSEAQCLSRNGRLTRGVKDTSSEGDGTCEEDVIYNSYEEKNYERYPHSATTDQEFYSLNVKQHYPNFESFSSALGVQTSQKYSRKSSSEDFFCSETRNFLSVEGTSRASPPKQQMRSTLSDHFVSCGGYLKETDTSKDGFLVRGSENGSREKRKAREMGGISVGGIGVGRGLKESISTQPKSRKPLRSHSRYMMEDSNPESSVECFTSKTDSSLNEAVFEKCGGFSRDNYEQESMNFSSQCSRGNSAYFESNCSENGSTSLQHPRQVENYGETSLNSNENVLINFQAISSMKISPKSRRRDISSEFQTDNCSEPYSCTVSENNCSNFVGTETVLPTFDTRENNFCNFGKTERDFANSDRKENDSCHFEGAGGNFIDFNVRENDSSNFDRTNSNCSSYSRRESCGFEGPCEAFECESCINCSSETLSTSSYSDCGPDCECRGLHSVTPELCDPAMQVPEVRWTARLLGGDEKEVEAFKAKKIASMKK